MIEALLIDDDTALIEMVLNTIDWKNFHIDRVHTAYSVSAAKQIFRSIPIAVAICDIEMPSESGIELIEWVRAENYDTQFIFLTSHERFDFAQSAIRFNASGYLVKPFNKTGVEAEITKAIKKVFEAQQIKQSVKFESWFAGNLEFIEGGFWKDLLTQRIVSKRENIESEIRKRNLPIDLSCDFKLILISSGRLSSIELMGGEDDVRKYEYEIARTAADMFCASKSMKSVVSYQWRGFCYTAVVIRDREWNRELYQNCEALITLIKDRLHITITIYVSNSHPIENLASATAQFEKKDAENVAFRGKTSFEDDQIILEGEFPHYFDFDQFRLLLQAKKKKEFLELLKQTLENLASVKKINTSTLNGIRHDLIQTVSVYLYNKGIQVGQLFSDTVSVTIENKAAETVTDMLRWTAYVLTRTIDAVDESERNESVVEKMKKFIRDHYAENITLTEIGAHVFLTPDYVAKIFRKETGGSLKQYLSDYRIEQAKKLLMSADKQIGDVAQQVGFDSFSYFSTVFKQTTGLTPRDFHLNSKNHR